MQLKVCTNLTQNNHVCCHLFSAHILYSDHAACRNKPQLCWENRGGLNVCTLLSNPSLRRILGFFSRFYFRSVVYYIYVLRYVFMYIYIYFYIVSWDFSGLVCVCQFHDCFLSYPLIAYCAHSWISCMVIFSNFLGSWDIQKPKLPFPQLHTSVVQKTPRFGSSSGFDFHPSPWIPRLRDQKSQRQR